MNSNYIYFVDLEDFLVCHNFGITNCISTSTLAHYGTSKELHPVYTLEIEELKNMQCVNTFTSPRLKFLTMANMSKNGLVLGVGIENTRIFDSKELQRINDIAKIEFEFERIRREVNPNLPSRLISIYLANDDFDGRTMLKNMFPNKKDFFIVPINIDIQLLFHKADSQWFDYYIETKDIKAIENYWKGIDYNKIPLYEYLLDGRISLRDEIDKAKILKEYENRH
ncbi:hypothetical protein [Flavobacterium undicola]|uniref:hypothetical protein n=1 Tax=Flavobacterium undicola TaxID=1932779 RepID=UPI0013773575|nr:hypothetical protein [Flavobacterium undicola]MBA0883422.1 hypothetical protein [Flavobacterium undicola]